MSDVWRICVVEDDISLNQNLVHSLREDGFVVEGVMNSADAMRILWSEEYKVVICDQDLSDGFELLRWLRSYRSNVRLIVLGDAGKAGESDQRLEAFKTGAIGYVQKPVDLCLLKDELHRLLRQTGFTASLDSFDLLDVIQVVAMSRKSIALLVDTGLEECGILRFQNGDLAWAEYGVLRGEDAFFALAVHKHGTVTQQVADEPFTTNITQPLSRLIFQALQYRTKAAHRQQLSEQGLSETDFAPVLPFENVSHPELFLPDDIDDSPFTFTSEAMVSNEPGPTQPMPQVVPAAPAFSVPQELFPLTTQSESPVIASLGFSQPDQYGYFPPPPAEDHAVNPYGNKILLGLVIATILVLIFAGLGGHYARGTKTVAERPTPTAKAQIHQKNPTAPAHSPTPMPTPTPTLVPHSQPTQPPPVGVNGNPWGYDFNPGNLIYSPPENFCDYFDCVKNFWGSSGYVDECNDETYSRSGGAANACVRHGGEMRPLYSH